MIKNLQFFLNRNYRIIRVMLVAFITVVLLTAAFLTLARLDDQNARIKELVEQTKVLGEQNKTLNTQNKKLSAQSLRIGTRNEILARCNARLTVLVSQQIAYGTGAVVLSSLDECITSLSQPGVKEFSSEGSPSNPTPTPQPQQSQPETTSTPNSTPSPPPKPVEQPPITGVPVLDDILHGLGL